MTKSSVIRPTATLPSIARIRPAGHLPPYCVGNRAKDKRERHEERRRLQADTSPQPESCCNIFRTGFAKLTRIDQQEGNAKDHEQDVDVQEQLRILLQ